MITAQDVWEQFEFNPLTGLLYRGGEVAGYINNCGYRSISIHNTKCLAHRLVLLWRYGVWPSHSVDHISGIRIDNRISNLRDVTHKVNTRNRRNVGVSFHQKSGKYRAYVNRDGKQYHLGLHQTKEQAQLAREVYDNNEAADCSS